MEFGEVVVRSVYGTTGYLADPSDLRAVEQMLMHNLPILRHFRQAVVATNYGEDARADLVAANTALWRAYLPNAVLLDHPVNRGHSIGTSDLDNLLFEHCRSEGIDWLCKGAHDVLLDEHVMSIPVVEADFYYLNAVSYADLAARNFDLDPFTSDYFFPQTTFYAINVAATDYLVDPLLLDRSWAIVNRIPDYNGRIWEHIPGWSCERLLRLCVERNGLSRCHVMSDEQYRRVLHLVIDQRIEDCSHKGLSINGICHFQGLTDVADIQVVT